MSREKIDLIHGVRTLAARRRPAAGEHPEPAALAAYHSGRLPAREAELLQDHLVRCPECAGLVLDLDELPEYDPSSVPERREPGAAVVLRWKEMEERLRQDDQLRTGEGEGEPEPDSGVEP